MTPQERDVIAGIFDRLKQAANQPRDPEAERFIADKLREQPYAPYAMAQAVYVQEQALLNQQAQVEQLQAQVRELEQRPAEPQGGGFLSGIFGGGQPAERPRTVPNTGAAGGAGSSGLWSNRSAAPGMNAAAAPQEQSAPGQAQPGPWGQQQTAAQQPGRGGGFLGSALTTAAGVAGGMMLGNVLMNAFKGDSTGGATKEANAGESASAQPASDGGGGYGDGSADAANYQQAGYDEPYDDALGGDFDDGGGDWA